MPEMLENWLAQTSALTVLAVIVGVVWAIRQIWRLIVRTWPVLKGTTKLVDALGELPEFMESLREWRESVDAKLDAHTEVLAVVKKEVLPNHGSSMRDRVEEIAARTASVESHEVTDAARLNALTQGFALLASLQASESPEAFRKQQLTDIAERLMQMPNQADSCWPQPIYPHLSPPVTVGSNI